jgi:hypothetical protein
MNIGKFWGNYSFIVSFLTCILVYAKFSCAELLIAVPIFLLVLPPWEIVKKKLGI